MSGNGMAGLLCHFKMDSGGSQISMVFRFHGIHFKEQCLIDLF